MEKEKMKKKEKKREEIQDGLDTHRPSHGRTCGKSVGVKLGLMNQREKLIEKLVTTMHLSVPERATLSNNVRYSKITKVVARVLDETGYFPPDARLWREGDVVHEGAILQKLPGGGFRLTVQRSHPIALTVLAAKKESDFQCADTPIKAFIRLERPNGIDGIAIRRFGLFGR